MLAQEDTPFARDPERGGDCPGFHLRGELIRPEEQPCGFGSAAEHLVVQAGHEGVRPHSEARWARWGDQAVAFEGSQVIATWLAVVVTVEHVPGQVGYAI